MVQSTGFFQLQETLKQAGICLSTVLPGFRGLVLLTSASMPQTPRVLSDGFVLDQDHTTLLLTPTTGVMMAMRWRKQSMSKCSPTSPFLYLLESVFLLFSYIYKALVDV